MNQVLEAFANQMLDSAINGLNEAAASQQKEVNYWKNQAQSLAGKYQACLYCQSEKYFMPELLACQPCHRKTTKQRCQACYSYFKIEELKKKEGYYWCKACQPSGGFTDQDYEKEETTC